MTFIIRVLKPFEDEQISKTMKYNWHSTCDTDLVCKQYKII